MMSSDRRAEGRSDRAFATPPLRQKQDKKQRESKTTFNVPRNDLNAITLAPIAKATMTVLMAVNTSPIVNNATATSATLKYLFAP